MVRTLEAGGTTLEESWRCGSAARRWPSVCQEGLDGARARLDAAAGPEGLAAVTTSRASERGRLS